MSKADFLPSWSIRQPLVHTCLGNVLGYKALKAKQSRQPVKDFERKLDQTWKLTCSFLESSDLWDLEAFQQMEEARTQDCPPGLSRALSHTSITSASDYFQPRGHGGELACPRALFPFQDTHTAPSPPQVLRTVKNSWLDQRSQLNQVFLNPQIPIIYLSAKPRSKKILREKQNLLV